MNPTNSSNPFHFTTPISDFVFNIAEPFQTKFFFNYTGTGDTVIAKLSGNPKTTGMRINSVVHEADGSYSIMFYGTPRQINKNDLTLTLRDNRNNIVKFTIDFFVNPVKLNPNSLEDATKLFSPYTGKIYFKFPENSSVNIRPKFAYNFPIEFGSVKTEDYSGSFLGKDENGDYTTITFNPSRVGKFKFIVEALSPDEILLGYRTIHLTVYESEREKADSKKKLKTPISDVSVKAVDIKDWR